MSEIDWQTLWPMIALAGVLLLMFWLVVVRPMQQRHEQQRQLIARLSEGDRIITAGGIHGKIVALRENEMDVEVADGCVLTLERKAIRRHLDQG